MKKIIILILIVFLTFIIYKVNDNNLIDYMSIGDSIDLGINSYGNYTYGYNNYINSYLKNNDLLHKYNNYFSKINYSLDELINDISSNKKIIYNDKTYNIMHELREADLITISIGMDDLIKILDKSDNNFLNIKEELDVMCYDMNNLIKNITSITKTNIILIGYYNPYNEYNSFYDSVFAYINDKYSSLSKKYSVYYLDIYEEIKKDKSYLPNKSDYHLTSKGYLKIASMVIEMIEETLDF